MDAAQQELESLLSQGTETPAPEAAPTTTQTAQPTVEEIEYYLGDKANKLPVNAQFQFTENGKTVKTPLSTMLNHYRQRSMLDQNSTEFKKQKEQFDSERKEWGDLETFRQLQKWSTDKPEEFQAIWDLYQNRDKHLLSQKTQDPNSQALIDELLAVKKELGGLKEFKGQFEKEREREVEKKNLAELDGEVDSFKKEFPEVDLDGDSDMILTDGRKASVKQAIMLFGYRHGIPDFESAALKYLKPKLFDLVSQRARDQTVKGVKADKAQGVIARSSMPGSGQSSKVDPKRMSWSEAKDAAATEFDTLLRG